MPERIAIFFEELFSTFRFADVLDVLAVSVILYFVLLWMRERASRSMMVATIIVGALFLLSRILDMYLTSLLFQLGLVIIVVTLVLAFNMDIRRAFERLASWGDIRRARLKHQEATEALDTVVEAVQNLASEKIGALVVFRGRESLEGQIRGGEELEGVPSTALLYSIFDPSSAGHDGAVIIQDGKIMRFGVHLPLSSNLSRVGSGGTRHAAALGLAESTDALVVAVSEERGTISIAQQGRLMRVTSASELRQRLEAFYRDIASPALARKPGKSPLTRHFGLKFLSVGLSLLLWLLFGYQVEELEKTYMVPIEFRNLPPQWIIENPRPTEARVTLKGAEREFDFDRSTLVVALDMSGIHEAQKSTFLTKEAVRKPPVLEVTQVQPGIVRFDAFQLIEVLLPVQPILRGALPQGLVLDKITTTPERVQVLVRRSLRGELNQIATEPITLDSLTRSSTVETRLVLPEYAQFPPGTPTRATVSITLDTTAAR
ncbi:MAG: diadenylate cyclase [Chitinivibrionales bacterium]